MPADSSSLLACLRRACGFRLVCWFVCFLRARKSQDAMPRPQWPDCLPARPYTGINHTHKLPAGAGREGEGEGAGQLGGRVEIACSIDCIDPISGCLVIMCEFWHSHHFTQHRSALSLSLSDTLSFTHSAAVYTSAGVCMQMTDRCVDQSNGFPSFSFFQLRLCCEL